MIEARIIDKIEEIEDYLIILGEIVPNNIEEYRSNYEKKWSCERGFENIIEAITDLAFLIIKIKHLKSPEDDMNSFEILVNNNIISQKLCEKLRGAKGMRNIIAHEYGKIDDEIVFDSISSEIERDAKKFIESIKKTLDKNER